MQQSGLQRKLKYLASINDDALGEDTNVDFEMSYIDIGNVDSSGRISELASYRFEDAPSRARRLVRDGDVIISTVRTYLQAITQIHEPPDNLVVSTGFAVVRPLQDRFDARYCRFALREPAFLAEVEKRSVGVNYPAINTTDLADIPIPVHPLPKQCAIADYLERETARLDALVAEKERLLKLLAEKRQALITHAITQGPVPMSLSSTPTSSSEQNEENTEAERDIHTETSVNTDDRAIATKRVSRRRLKYLSTINDESLDEDTDTNLEIRYIDIGNVDPFGNTEEPALYRFGSAPSRARRCVRDGDVIVSTVRTYLQAITQIHDAPDNLVVSTGFAVIRPIEDEFHADYCKYAVRESTFLAEVEKRSVGVSYPAINTTDLANIPVSVHPLSQQCIIADHIDRETTRLDTLMAKVRETIALLGERRAALVAAAVTGRIDVGGSG